MRVALEGDGEGAVVDREFEALVAAMVPGLYRRAQQLCRDRFDPDDLVQDTLVRAFRSRAKVRDRARVSAWLRSIITNVFIDAVRAQRVRPPQVTLEVAEAACAGEEVVEASRWQQIDLDDLRAAIDRLPQDVRETYRLFALERKDYLAIAAAQKIPMGTVGTRLRRARGHLRRLLLAALENADESAAPRGARDPERSPRSRTPGEPTAVEPSGNGNGRGPSPA